MPCSQWCSCLPSPGLPPTGGDHTPCKSYTLMGDRLCGVCHFTPRYSSPGTYPHPFCQENNPSILSSLMDLLVHPSCLNPPHGDHCCHCHPLSLGYALACSSVGAVVAVAVAAGVGSSPNQKFYLNSDDTNHALTIATPLPILT